MLNSKDWARYNQLNSKPERSVKEQEELEALAEKQYEGVTITGKLTHPQDN